MRKRISVLVTLIIITLLGIIIILNNKNKEYEITDDNDGQFAFYYEDENGEYQRSTDSKWSTGDYFLNLENSSCDGEKNPKFLSWNNDNNSVILTRNKTTKCSLYFLQREKNFAFNESIQEFIAPVTGTYKLEVWGAQGGTSEKYAKEGKGGYSSGNVFLNAGEKLYVVVGGQGEGFDGIGSPEKNYQGGYNGGGSGSASISVVPQTGTKQYAFGGGGATHIAKSLGLLSSLEDKKSDILIVAGGGGGNGDIGDHGKASGGAGGGLQGTNGFDSVNNTYSPTFNGSGGTQDSAGMYPTTESNLTTGSFGQGGNAINQIWGGAGGGGGFYGGSQSSRGHAGGGGGSGYIGNPLLINGETITGNESMPSPNGNTETGHEGNGFAKITLLDEIDENVSSMINNFEYKGNVQEFIPSVSGFYKIELWGAQGGDIATYQGGKGAYTKGIIYLTTQDKLYVYVGGAGSNTEKGGFNGGANLVSGQSKYGSSGGGATDIRLVSSEWNDFNSLKSRIMVAAGGGGANNRNRDIDNVYWFGAGNGGYGGGLVGGMGESIDHINPENNQSYGYGLSSGGTQTAGGMYDWTKGTSGIDDTLPPEYAKFGYSLPNQSTGGGGYYGGGGGNHSAASGGSSFISGYQGCVAIEDTSTEGNIIFKDNCTEENALNNIACSYHYSGKVFTNTLMKAGNSPMPSPDGNIETGHSGNGHARITLLS